MQVSDEEILHRKKEDHTKIITSIGEVVSRTSLGKMAPGSIPDMAYSTYRPPEFRIVGELP